MSETASVSTSISLSSDSPIYSMSVEEYEMMEGISELLTSQVLDAGSNQASTSSESPNTLSTTCFSEKLLRFQAVANELISLCNEANDAKFNRQVIDECERITHALSKSIVESQAKVMAPIPGESAGVVSKSKSNPVPGEPPVGAVSKSKNKRKGGNTSQHTRHTKLPKTLDEFTKATNVTIADDDDDHDDHENDQVQVANNENYSTARKDPRLVLCETVELVPMEMSTPVVFTPIESIESVQKELSQSSTLQKLCIVRRLAGNTGIMKQNCARFRTQANLQHALTGLALIDLQQDLSNGQVISFVEFFKRLRKFSTDNKFSDPILVKSYAILKRYVDYYYLYQSIPNVKYMDVSVSSLAAVGLVGLRTFLQNSQTFHPHIYKKFFEPLSLTGLQVL